MDEAAAAVKWGFGLSPAFPSWDGWTRLMATVKHVGHQVGAGPVEDGGLGKSPWTSTGRCRGRLGSGARVEIPTPDLS